MTNDMLIYYAQPGLMTDLGPYAYLFDSLPTDIPTLVKTLQGVMVHIFWAGSYGLELTDERKAEVNRRYVEKQLARILELDNRPSSARQTCSTCRTMLSLVQENGWRCQVAVSAIERLVVCRQETAFAMADLFGVAHPKANWTTG